MLFIHHPLRKTLFFFFFLEDTIFIPVLQRRKLRLREGQAPGPTVVSGTARAPAFGPNHTDCARTSQETGASGPSKLGTQRPRGEGECGRWEEAGGSQGTRPSAGPGHTPPPCLPPASFEPWGEKKQNRFRRRETSGIQMGAQVLRIRMCE